MSLPICISILVLNITECCEVNEIFLTYPPIQSQCPQATPPWLCKTTQHLSSGGLLKAMEWVTCKNLHRG
jgi:hypothetical protein